MPDLDSVADSASGADLNRVVMNMLGAVETEPIPFIIMASIALTLVLQKGDLTMDELNDGIHAVSVLIADYLDGREAAGQSRIVLAN